MSAMDALEELLPGIEEFLVKALAREKLAAATEKKRLFFIERLEVIKMPPSLPPSRGLRPPGVAGKDGENGGDLESGIRDSYIAMQRVLSRFSQPTQDDGETYDDLDSPPGPPSHAPPPPPVTDRVPVAAIHTNGVNAFADDDDDLYEVPVGQEDSGMLSDEYESTSYESYDDEEDGGSAVYENQEFHDKKHRVKTKKKKKSNSRTGSQEVIAKNLPNVIHSGDLWQKGKITWTRRYAAIQDAKLLVFKSEKETKPLLNICLTGYDAMCMDKDGKRHVIRISQPGYETHWFSADAKDKADRWVDMIGTVSQGGSGGSVHRSESSSHDHSTLSQLSSENASAEQSSVTNASLSGSEGGSGDGTVGSLPLSPKHSADGDLEKKLPLSKQKAAKAGVMDSLSNFIGTLGRKKGRNVNKAAGDFDKFEVDPDALVSGLLTAYSEKTNKKWVQRWCVVKDGNLEIYNDSGEEGPEMSIILSGCDIQNAKVNKRQLAIRLVKEGKELVTLDTADTLEQGKWLGVLIKESGCGSHKPSSSSVEYTYMDEDEMGEAPVATAEDDDVYDEVYEHNMSPVQIIAASGLSSSSGIPRVPDARKIPRSGGRQDGGAVPPPPLPSTAPPIHRAPLRGRKVGDAEDGQDTWYDDARPYESHSDDSGNNNEDVYENENIALEIQKSRQGHGVMDLATRIDDKIYENAGAFNTNEDYENTGWSLPKVKPVKWSPPKLKPIGSKQKDNKGPKIKSPFGLKLPGANELQSSKNNSEKQFPPENPDSVKKERSPVPSPRGVKQVILALEGVTVEETDDSTPQLYEDDDVYEDAETVVSSLSKESERKDIQMALKKAEEDVVKCHSGPTIKVDKEILDQTENPILTQLRRQRKERGTSRQSEIDDVRENINQTKRKLAQLKKKRAEVRSKKLCSIDVDEKLKLGRELRLMDREQDKIEAELSKHQDKETELLKEERAALRASLRGTSCTTSSTSRASTTSSTLGSPKSTRLSTTTTTSFANGSGSWRHVDPPSKSSSSSLTEIRSYSSYSSPTSRAKFGAGSARGPFASRYNNDSFSNFGGSAETSPSTSPKLSSYRSKDTVKVVKTVSSGNSSKASTLTTVTSTQRTRYGLGPRSSTLPPGLEFHSRRGDQEEERPPSPRGGRERVKGALKLWESRNNTTSEC